MVIRKQASRRKPAKPPAGGVRKRAPKAKRTIWDEIIELGKQIPPEEAARHPVDGAENLDHYLYGWPKRDE